MGPTIDDRVLQAVKTDNSVNEWQVARLLYRWDDYSLRAKHGAWIRAIVLALRRLHEKGLVVYFFSSDHCRYWSVVWERKK